LPLGAAQSNSRFDVLGHIFGVPSDAGEAARAPSIKPRQAPDIDITWHVARLAKRLGAGLRIAYVVAPDVRSGWLFASSVRTATVMASPVTIALATRWITDGTADALLAAVR
jgi:DNA-binding transcriptional MocR family regulator